MWQPSANKMAHPLHFQKLERALDLTGFINQVERLLETPTNNEGSIEADLDGSTKDIWPSEIERIADIEKFYNFKDVGKRSWLKDILLENSDSDSDSEITEEDLKVILKIHKCRRNYQKNYHQNILNSQYTYYAAGLLSEEDKFSENQKYVRQQYGFGMADVDSESSASPALSNTTAAPIASMSRSMSIGSSGGGKSGTVKRTHHTMAYRGVRDYANIDSAIAAVMCSAAEAVDNDVKPVVTSLLSSAISSSQIEDHELKVTIELPANVGTQSLVHATVSPMPSSSVNVHSVKSEPASAIPLLEVKTTALITPSSNTSWPTQPTLPATDLCSGQITTSVCSSSQPGFLAPGSSALLPSSILVPSPSTAGLSLPKTQHQQRLPTTRQLSSESSEAIDCTINETLSLAESLLLQTESSLSSSLSATGAASTVSQATSTTTTNSSVVVFAPSLTSSVLPPPQQQQMPVLCTGTSIPCSKLSKPAKLPPAVITATPAGSVHVKATPGPSGQAQGASTFAKPGPIKNFCQSSTKAPSGHSVIASKPPSTKLSPALSTALGFPLLGIRPSVSGAELDSLRQKVWRQIATEEVPKLYTEKYIFRKYRSIVVKNMAMWCESYVFEKLNPPVNKPGSRNRGTAARSPKRNTVTTAATTYAASKPKRPKTNSSGGGPGSGLQHQLLLPPLQPPLPNSVVTTTALEVGPSSAPVSTPASPGPGTVFLAQTSNGRIISTLQGLLIDAGTISTSQQDSGQGTVVTFTVL